MLFPVHYVPTTPQTPSKQAFVKRGSPCLSLEKIVRIVLAIFLVIATLGLILLFYSFSELTSFSWICQKCCPSKEEIPLPLPSSPPPSPILPYTPPPSPVTSRRKSFLKKNLLFCPRCLPSIKSLYEIFLFQHLKSYLKSKSQLSRAFSNTTSWTILSIIRFRRQCYKAASKIW